MPQRPSPCRQLIERDPSPRDSGHRRNWNDPRRVGIEPGDRPREEMTMRIVNPTALASVAAAAEPVTQVPRSRDPAAAPERLHPVGLQPAARADQPLRPRGLSRCRTARPARVASARSGDPPLGRRRAAEQLAGSDPPRPRGGSSRSRSAQERAPGRRRCELRDPRLAQRGHPLRRAAASSQAMAPALASGSGAPWSSTTALCGSEPSVVSVAVIASSVRYGVTPSHQNSTGRSRSTLPASTSPSSSRSKSIGACVTESGHLDRGRGRAARRFQAWVAGWSSSTTRSPG